MKDKLWCDLKTNQEKIEFLRSGRAHETGIISPALAADFIDALETLEYWKSHYNRLKNEKAN